jgi:hypothetical protein
MEKIICKCCGNEFLLGGHSGKVICQCGSILRISGTLSEQERVFKASQKLKAEIILQASLIRREIDRCLDDRNKERFQKLSSQLRQLHDILNKEWLLMDQYTSLKKKLNSIVFK